MTKEEILGQLESQREQFLDSLEGLSDEEFLTPGVVGDWSIKDILAHLSRWEAELVKMLWQARQGQKPTSVHFTPNFDVDETNQEWYKETRDRPLAKMLDDFHAVRNQTILRVEAFTEKELTDPKRYSWTRGRPLAEWIASDSFEHEAEHLVNITHWRKQNPK